MILHSEGTMGKSTLPCKSNWDKIPAKIVKKVYHLPCKIGAKLFTHQNATFEASLPNIINIEIFKNLINP